ncbi:MAG: type III-B CRISPR module-associated Cmr3 family protein [Candidatus Competibacteraceae bacterium]
MNTHYLTLAPRDPLISRDGRPFGNNQGTRMKSLEWFYPSVLAGSLRSLLGKQVAAGFTPLTIEMLKKVAIAGPLPCLNDELYYPAPQDLLVYEDDAKKKDDAQKRQFMCLRPSSKLNGAGCNLPHPDLLPMQITQDVKQAPAPAFWSLKRLIPWLLEKDIEIPPAEPALNSGFLNAPQKEARTHVAIAPASGTAQEGMLFTSMGLDLGGWNHGAPVNLAARVQIQSDSPWVEALSALNAFHPLGGERRLLHWQVHRQATSSKVWDCPDEVREALQHKNKVRMVLATPALFREGWKPAWLNDQLQGCPPGTSVTLKLVAACTGRRAVQC